MKLLYAIFALLGFTSPVFGQQYTSNLNLTYEENAVITVGSQVINLNDTYYVNSAALDPAYINTNDYVRYPSLITANGHHMEIIGLNDSSGIYPASTIIVEKVIEMNDDTISTTQTQMLEIKLWIANNDSTETINNVYIEEDLTEGLKADYGTVTKGGTTTVAITNGEREFNYTVGTLAASTSSSLTFIARPYGDDGTELGDGITYYYSNLYFDAKDFGGIYRTVGPVPISVCVVRENNEISNLFYQHGFTALAFFTATLLGILLVALFAVLYVIFITKRRKSVVGIEDQVMMEKGKNIILNPAEVMKTGNTILDYSSTAADDSIVGILSMKDRLKRYREIDGLDIVSSIKVDTDIETERNDATVQATVLLLNGLHQNKDLSSANQQQVQNNFKKKRTNLDKNLDDEYKREVKKLYKKLGAKNKARMSHLLQKQKDERKKIVSEMHDLGDKERNQLLKMLDKQHQAEQTEETYKLKLEQDEETENLRKEFGARKRVGLKELQQGMLTEAGEIGLLDQQKMNWMLEEHRKTQEKLEKTYDEEISRQRMLLEEKLERRRALAKSSETQEDDQSYLLNTMAGHQLTLIEETQKSSGMGHDQAQKYIEEAKAELMALNERREKEREKQEEALHKKLSALKKQQLDNKRKEQKTKMDDFEARTIGTQSEGPVDPENYLTEKAQLQSKNRQELYNLEKEIDGQQATELEQFREESLDKTKEELHVHEENLIKKLEHEGMDRSRINKLLDKHEREVDRLETKQKEQQQIQKRHIDEVLAQRRQEWGRKKEQEKVEQEQLREYEAKVVNKLICGQMSISDEERDRIMKEHEKQMVKLENSLTLNKLRQKRMLEEKLSQKKAQLMQNLQEKQVMDRENLRRKLEHNAEEDDEEGLKKKMSLMKAQADHRMAVLQGNRLNMDDAMDEVRIEMMKERAQALKDQEERLGAMVASLQMSKAKELAKIEQQQKAINNLKTNLLEDLNSRDLLNDTETQKIIQSHRQAQDDLNKQMEEHRVKQEKMLKKKLRDRLELRQKAMEEQQRTELQEILVTCKNKTAMRIREALLLHKQMIAMEQFRNQLDREIAQTLENVRQEYNLKRMQKMQEQEYEFIGGLVKYSSLQQSECVAVLNMLFPSKTDEEIKKIMATIYGEQALGQKDKDNERRNSSLLRRVQGLEKSSAPWAQLSDSTGSRKSPKKKGKKKKMIEEDDYYDNEQDFGGYGERPEPLGGHSENYYEDHSFDTHQRFRNYENDSDRPTSKSNKRRSFGEDIHFESPVASAPRQLPPLPAEAGGRKKKKKKLLKKLAESTYRDEDNF
ncbi:limbin-like [Mytilus trossulus]|uniref:limbin-like n=1 Tax=Mytilus trossulus TaxID=6551 RepID=UPI003007C980